MKTVEKNALMQEMNLQEMNEISGGFIPLVIWGVAFSAKTVAGACGATFLAGMGIGAMAASDRSR